MSRDSDNSAAKQHLDAGEWVSKAGVVFGQTRCGIRFRRRRFLAKVVQDSALTTCDKCKKPGSAVLL